ncbi:MAG: carboxylesterase family protein [Planctomycetota bacterium]
MRNLSLLLLLVICILVTGCAGEKVTIKTGQHAMVFEKEIVKKAELEYWLYLPADYLKVDKEWPLIMFLHGAGESGDNIDNVLVHGPPRLASEGKDFPFIIISPQCPMGVGWADKTDELIALCDHITDTYAVDKNRLYITGLSMGGYGTWHLIERYPEKFAAAAPICGGGDEDNGPKLKNLPIWVFHGAKDGVIPISQSEEMVEAIKEAGSENIKFTIYPEANHDSWTETYNNPELYEWFLEHTVQ